MTSEKILKVLIENSKVMIDHYTARGEKERLGKEQTRCSRLQAKLRELKGPVIDLEEVSI